MKSLSGKFVLRLPPALHVELKREALARGISLNQLCLDRLQGSSASLGWVDEIVRMNLPLQAVVLFGSQTRGTQTSSSDIDVLLVLRSSEVLERKWYRLWEEKVSRGLLERRIEPQFVLLPKSVEDAGGLWFEVALEGQIVWEENKETRQLLHNLREKISEGHVKRRVSHGHSYWVKK